MAHGTGRSVKTTGPFYVQAECAACGREFNLRRDFVGALKTCLSCEAKERAMAGRKKTTNGAAPDTAHAQGKNGAHDPVERTRYQESLPCSIVDADVQSRANELAKVIRQRDRLLDEKRESNATYRERIAFFDERLKELAESVEGKTERRPVDCIEWLYPELGEVRVVRTDTNEVVESRTATAEDMQESLVPRESKRKAGRKSKGGESGASATAE
jgi:hypothetical protein